MKLQYESIKKFLPLAVIFLVAGLSGYMVYNYIKKNSDQLERKYAERDQKNQLDVVVASANLPVGTVASSGTMSMISLTGIISFSPINTFIFIPESLFLTIFP